MPEMFSRKHPTLVDEFQCRVFFSRAGLEQRLGVDGTQPDGQAVVGGQSFDKELKTGEGEVGHFTESGSAQQSPHHHVFTLL